MEKTKLELEFIGIDFWSRPVYKDENGRLFKDTNCGEGTPELCTVCGDFEGETDTPIEHLKRYQHVEIVITNAKDLDSKENRFNYQMLDRLKSDCDYFLGYGFRSINCLYYKDIDQHISEMIKLHNGFDANKKPEWLTMDKIMEYEKLMKEGALCH